jgi:hypothetical protein
VVKGTDPGALRRRRLGCGSSSRCCRVRFQRRTGSIPAADCGQLSSLIEQLRADQRGLLRAIKRVLPGDDKTQLLLVIDQFEELFTLVEREEVRAHFLDSLMAALDDPHSRLRVILTLRADFHDRPLQYRRFGELLRQRTEIVLPLSPAELERLSGSAG